MLVKKIEEYFDLMKVIPGNNQSKGRGLMLGRIRFDVSA
jgi:hypothetical protein